MHYRHRLHRTNAIDLFEAVLTEALGFWRIPLPGMSRRWRVGTMPLEALLKEDSLAFGKFVALLVFVKI
jgi:hypothetical protein